MVKQDTRSPASLRRSRRGNAILETALAMPVLLLMACGTMDLARVFFAGIVVESAARAGTQHASYSPGKAGANDESEAAGTKDASYQGVSPVTITSRAFCACSGTEVSCSTATCSGATPDGYVETTATYTFRPLLRYPGFPTTVPLTGRSRVRVQ